MSCKLTPAILASASLLILTVAVSTSLVVSSFQGKTTSITGKIFENELNLSTGVEKGKGKQ